MSEIRLVLTDLDGTVAEFGQHVVSERVKESIIEVQESGVTVTAVTGRPYWLAYETLNVLGISGPCVIDGGATIINAESGQTLWKNWLEASRVRVILDRILPMCVRLELSDSNTVVDAHEVEVGQIQNDMPSIFAFIDEKREAELENVMKNTSGVYHYIFTGMDPNTGERERSIQISDSAATKHHGVEALRKLIKVHKKHTLAIGDGDNDIELFRSAGMKIAMGNATEGLKSKADAVVGTISDDGFVQAMNRYVLLKQHH